MATYKAAVFKSTQEPLEIVERPVPEAKAGSVLVKVAASNVLPYLKNVLNGTIPYVLAPPFTPSSSCIARVCSVPPDATILEKGQLVLCDITVRARDDPENMILLGLHGGVSPSLMSHWSHGSFGEMAVFPLENVFPLDESVLLGKLGYAVEDLCAISACNVPFGGLASIALQPGETIIVAPATGKFGGAAVSVALAMGARVIAAARSADALTNLKSLHEPRVGERIRTVVLTGDVGSDKKSLAESAGNGGTDCYIDFSPPAAANSTHISSCLAALKASGRAVLMGGVNGEVKIDYGQVMLKSLIIRGRFMYERHHTQLLVKMVENGLLPLGANAGFVTVARFALGQIGEALDAAEENPGFGKQVVIMP